MLILSTGDGLMHHPKPVPVQVGSNEQLPAVDDMSKMTAKEVGRDLLADVVLAEVAVKDQGLVCVNEEDKVWCREAGLSCLGVDLGVLGQLQCLIPVGGKVLPGTGVQLTWQACCGQEALQDVYGVVHTTCVYDAVGGNQGQTTADAALNHLLLISHDHVQTDI